MPTPGSSRGSLDRRLTTPSPQNPPLTQLPPTQPTPQPTRVILTSNAQVGGSSKATAHTQLRGNCRKKLAGFVRSKPGLYKFYPEQSLEQGLGAESGRAADMFEGLIALGCTPETAYELIILVLYDLVLLIDDSMSMETEEDGNRIKTLAATFRQISEIYDLASESGITSVVFLNNGPKTPQKNIKHDPDVKLIRNHTYSGLTKLGTKLRHEVLDKFVFDQKRTKPLLVMTITDGTVEGESPSKLRNAIIYCAGRLEADAKNLHGSQAVALHFSHLGNDDKAKQLLTSLSMDQKLGKVVDCLPASENIEKEIQMNKWFIVPRMMLGAIERNKWEEDADTDDIQYTYDKIADHN